MQISLAPLRSSWTLFQYFNAVQNRLRIQLIVSTVYDVGSSLLVDPLVSPYLSRDCLWAGPPTSHINPFRQAAALLALHVDDVGIAAAAAAHAILLGRVPVLPIVILFESLALVQCSLLQVSLAGKLSAQRRVRGTMLDGRMPVSKIAEVVDVARGQESTGGEGMDGRITPLD